LINLLGSEVFVSEMEDDLEDEQARVCVWWMMSVQRFDLATSYDKGEFVFIVCWIDGIPRLSMVVRGHMLDRLTTWMGLIMLPKRTPQPKTRARWAYRSA